jgi:putative hydrolase
MLNAARDRGLKGLAITDHGSFVGGSANSVFFERLTQPVPGIRLYKGVEANVMDRNGRIDVNSRYLKWTDIVLLGYHHFPEEGLDPREYSDIMIGTLECNPCVDVVTHPNMPDFPMEYRSLAREARRLGVAVELNNSKLALGRASEDTTRRLVEICAEEEALVVVNSDAHTVEEPGETRAIRTIMEEIDVPLNLVINRTLESTESWIRQRRPGKLVPFNALGCARKA